MKEKMEIVEKISKVDRDGMDKPKEDVVMNEITIEE